MAGIRLDQRVVQLGLVESREKAQRLILAGCVKVNDRVETKSSHQVPEDAVVALVEQERFVGRVLLARLITSFMILRHG